MATLPKTLLATGIVLGGILGGAVTGASVGASPAASPAGSPAGSGAVSPAAPTPPTPVRRNQFFTGLVNGHSGTATIEVLCPGPLRMGQTGKPVAGQTIGVEKSPAVSTAGGFTGNRGHSIVAEFVPTSTVGAAIKETFTDYGNQPIPTSVRLPCTGTSTVLFAPRPTSPTAQSVQVTVTFVATCDTPACPVDTSRDRAPR